MILPDQSWKQIHGKTHCYFGTHFATEKSSLPEVTVCVLVLFVEEMCVHLVPSLLEHRGQMFLEVNEDRGVFVLFIEIWA